MPFSSSRLHAIIVFSNFSPIKFKTYSKGKVKLNFFFIKFCCRYPYAYNPQGLPERTNEAAGEYATACIAVAEECGVPVIDLWTKMQQCPDWRKEYLW